MHRHGHNFITLPWAIQTSWKRAWNQFEPSATVVKLLLWSFRLKQLLNSLPLLTPFEHLDVFEPAQLRTVSRVQKNKLFTPPFLLTSKSWQHAQPQISVRGLEEELPVTKQPQCHLSRHARVRSGGSRNKKEQPHWKASSAGFVRKTEISRPNCAASGKRNRSVIFQFFMEARTLWNETSQEHKVTAQLENQEVWLEQHVHSVKPVLSEVAVCLIPCQHKHSQG